MNLAVIGAGGFVGSAVVQLAIERGCGVRALVRRRDNRDFDRRIEVVETGDLLSGPLPPTALQGCDAVVNCAARVHVLRETEADPEAAYRALNSDLPVTLLNAALDAGVNRFVQLSSVAAIASRSPRGVTITDETRPQPQSSYGRSKLEADERLQKLGKKRRMSIVILRPPSVFGEQVRAYFRMLLRCAKLGLPLPIGGVANRRSFMFLGNLADAIVTAAAGTHEGVYIVTDSPPIPTADLYRSLLRLCGRAAFVPSLPSGMTYALARVALGDRADSLLGDAAYDGSRFAEDFQWSPPVDFNSALQLTVAGA